MLCFKPYEHLQQTNITKTSSGYLLISLLPPSKLQEILGKVRKAIQTTNPDYDIVIKRLH